MPLEGVAKPRNQVDFKVRPFIEFKRVRIAMDLLCFYVLLIQHQMLNQHVGN